ncbi:uncharacterized protein J3R85_016783 [Psidium guajava]|nr:uncharacterized protein J3R85_016783 [Psidium guajava]
MARDTKSCSPVACVLLLLVLCVSSTLLVSAARPLSNAAADSVSGDAVKKGVKLLIEGLYVQTIKAGGGPSSGGKGHGFPGVAHKNSGPSPGEGH